MVAAPLLTIVARGWTVARQSGAAAIGFRVGILLLATALAWPQLASIGRKLPSVLWAALGGLLLLAAARPKLIPMALTVGALIVAVHYVLRWGSKSVTRKGP